MFKVIHSNSTERLVETLINDCAEPLADPMQPEIILVQNPGMARWLSHQFAQRTGIAANMSFPLPASFVWQLQQTWLGTTLEQGSYDRDSLRWWLMRLIPEHLDAPACQRLKAYLGNKIDKDSALRLYQLAGRLADHFDQYLVYRPDLLLEWESGTEAESGTDAAWQAELWRALVQANGSEHRASLFERFRQATTAAPKDPLPERVSVFGLSALAPVYLEALHHLSRHAQVNFYLPNPCREYWADIEDERSQARRRARWRASGKTDISSLMDLGNPLLAANGQMAQVLVDQLLELECQMDEAFVEEPLAPGLLGELQMDILELRDPCTADATQHRRLDKGDASLRVHGCHSQLREVQVLHDQLRRAFDECDELRPQEVIVMAPSISDYAPWIEAVFGQVENGGIPWSIADTAPTETPLYRAIETLLDLPGSRFEASSLMALLEVPAVMQRFALDQTSLERIRTWVHESGIRWGLDGAMRTSFGLPKENANSWDFGLQRLLYGYALPLESGLCNEVLPYGELEGGETEALGQLAECVERLRQWHKTLAMPAQASEWQKRLNELLDDFFDPGSDDAALLQSLRHAMADLVRKTNLINYETPIGLDIIRAELATCLSQQSSAAGFLSGRVTFCNLVPMRGIPFRIICLLGLNEGQFPRHDPSPGFNLMAAKARIGDRSKRLDDRYLFLEALQSARERLLLFYQSRNQQNNALMPSSVVLSELLDYIRAGYRSADDGDPLASLITEHPLQPFSRRYYDGSDPRLFSYDHQWLAAIKPESAAEATATTETASNPVSALELADLILFLKNPADWYLRRSLNARDQGEVTLLADDEPFTLDGLTSYDYKSVLLENKLSGEQPDPLHHRAQHSGDFPPGNLGKIKLDELDEAMDELADSIRPLLKEPKEALEVDIEISGMQLRGWLNHLFAAGQVRWRPSSLKAKDRIDLWVRHLALCLIEPATSQLMMQDKRFLLEPLESEKTTEYLQQLIRLWQRGQEEPLPFFPEASLAFAQAMAKGDTPEQALTKADKAWRKDDYGTGPGTQAVASLFRGQEPLKTQDFANIAQEVFGPMLEQQA